MLFNPLKISMGCSMYEKELPADGGLKPIRAMASIPAQKTTPRSISQTSQRGQVFGVFSLGEKNITFGYTLPAANFFKSARLYASVQNAFMFTKYPGMNPEAGIAGLNGLNQGRDWTAFPIAITYSMGVNINF